jgi:hypothetical protein
LTQYLTGKPFTVAVAPKNKLTAEEYFIAVGALPPEGFKKPAPKKKKGNE